MHRWLRRSAPLGLLASLVLLVGCGDSAGDGGSGGASQQATSGGDGDGDVEPPAMNGMLDGHNDARAAVDPAAASPLTPLVWSDSLQNIAQKHADKCVFAHSTDHGYGENLYAAAGQQATPAQVVESWVSEVAAYDYATNGCSDVCGHYTQVVWADTLRLGCAMATCTTGSPFPDFDEWELWTCNYDPPGNWVGEKPY